MLLDGRQPRRWHVDLLERLARRPHVQVHVDARFAPSRAVADSLFHIETLLHGLPRTGLSSLAPMSALEPFVRDSLATADLTLDLRGDDRRASGRTLWVTYDGVAGEGALIAAIISGRTPVMEVVGVEGVVAAGRLGAERAGIARAMFEDMLARSTTLIVAALDGAAGSKLPSLPAVDVPVGATMALSTSDLPRIAVAMAARKAVRQMYRLGFRTPHWRVGWRKTDGGDLFDLRRHPDAGWTDLADDGRRFYADPFPILHGAQVTLFVEEFEHRSAKGVISAVEMGPEGPIGVPRRVLEQPGHLSYPFVFEREGSFWMIPESCSAGVIDLYRATAFPGGWVREATLVSGVVASDATLLRREGLWWLFATVRDEGGSFSDALHLWSAPDFRGPWTPHPRNPVLIDIASARPAGRFVERDGVLYRPVQDCRHGYGAALGIARVDRLDPRNYAQTVETLLTAGPKWSGRRLHTLNSAGGFEFIDGSAWAPRWKAWGRQG